MTKEIVSRGAIVTDDPWTVLRTMTAARVALGRSGTSLPLKESLAFKLDHARARDAVHSAFALAELAQSFHRKGFDFLELQSAVVDRQEYLTRPDKGRLLDEPSKAKLSRMESGGDVCFVVADGLSARAIHEQAVSFVDTAASLLLRAGLTLAPVCLVRNGRVAVGDAIGTALQARLVAVLIGERPGLSSPNSMGLYLTFEPAPGFTDERRNCISNIRDGGISIEEAVRKFGYLVEEALRLGKSGVELKDRMVPNYLPFGLPLLA